jgi:hypothetical protein
LCNEKKTKMKRFRGVERQDRNPKGKKKEKEN